MVVTVRSVVAKSLQAVEILNQFIYCGMLKFITLPQACEILEVLVLNSCASISKDSGSLNFFVQYLMISSTRFRSDEGCESFTKGKISAIITLIKPVRVVEAKFSVLS